MSAPTTPDMPLSALERILLGVFMLVPLTLALLGAWVGTTLAIYLDGPVWLAIIGAIAAFFLLPLGWELLADRHQRGGRVRDAILRSSVLSFAFIAALVGTHPETAFKALATRGDWFLGGARGGAADDVRSVLFTLADGLEWLNDWTRTKLFREVDEGGTVSPGTAPESATRVTTPGTATEASTSTAPEAPTEPAPAVLARYAIPGTSLIWPLPAVPEPEVADMPEEVKVSIKSIGTYLADKIEDPYRRAKAVHDFVAFWVRYDFETLEDMEGAPSSYFQAETVFKRHLGVCSGYSRLTTALGKAAKLEVIGLSGDSRNSSDYREIAADQLPAADLGHAWNAVRIEGRWFLLDTTWDADISQRDGKPGHYATTYLFTPPEFMLWDHRPDVAKWQLTPKPLTRGEWLRQPLLQPSAAAFGIKPRVPDGPIVSASGALVAVVDNPQGVWMLMNIVPGGPEPCPTPTNGALATIECSLPKGRSEARIFVATTRRGTYKYVGGAFVDGD